jgi:hypothetical protein
MTRDFWSWPCHSKPIKDWCDLHGLGGFMGHTCEHPFATVIPICGWLEPGGVARFTESQICNLATHCLLRGMRPMQILKPGYYFVPFPFSI